jgi:hypothetical protein
LNVFREDLMGKNMTYDVKKAMLADIHVYWLCKLPMYFDNRSHLNLLLWIHWTKINQTWMWCFLFKVAFVCNSVWLNVFREDLMGKNMTYDVKKAMLANTHRAVTLHKFVLLKIYCKGVHIFSNAKMVLFFFDIYCSSERFLIILCLNSTIQSNILEKQMVRECSVKDEWKCLLLLYIIISLLFIIM